MAHVSVVKTPHNIGYNSEHRELYSNMGMRMQHNLPYDEIEILSSGSW